MYGLSPCIDNCEIPLQEFVFAATWPVGTQASATAHQVLSRTVMSASVIMTMAFTY
jgi:hypothetical protein